jgi:hypothetical protein
MLWPAYNFSFFQYCGFQTLGFYKNAHMKDKNFELVRILFESHCEYLSKKHSSWDSCAQKFSLMNILFELFDIK